MKRLAVYFSVLVGCLFIGLTTYYMVKNYECITINYPSADELGLDAIYLNVGEETNLEISHTRKQTQLHSSLTNQDIISFDLETGKIVALAAGETEILITTENENYGPFNFKIKVGNGSSEAPYYIKSEADLRAVGGTRTYGEGNSVTWSASANYKVLCDINLTEGEWKPLCNDPNVPFTGKLEGNQHPFKITGMTIRTNQEFAGFFAYISDLATVSNLTFVNPTIIGQFNFVGVVAAMSSGSTITKVWVENALIKAAPYTTSGTSSVCFVGGIVGATEGVFAGFDGTKALADRGIVSMCSFQGKIGTLETAISIVEQNDVALFEIGGITGYVLGTTLHNNKAEVGFDIEKTIANKSLEFIKKDESHPENKGISIHVGGIAGAIAESNEIEYYEDGTSKIAGTIYPIVKNNLAIVKINNATNEFKGVIGNIPLTVQYVNAFDGTPAAQRVIGNYFYSPDNSMTNGGSTLANATTLLTEMDLKKQSSYVTDSTEKWSIGEALSAWSIVEGEAPRINEIGMESATYFEQDTYKIESKEDFVKYYNRMTSTSLSDVARRYWLRQNYVLATDINLGSITEITALEPIGGGKFTFCGTFDGAGHTITMPEGFVYEGENLAYAGLFGQLNTTAEIKNLTVVGVSTKGVEYAGAIAGISYGKITNCVVKNITIEDATYGGAFVGVNYGIISSTLGEANIDSTGSAINTIKSNKEGGNVFAGSVAAINHGTISGIEVHNYFVITGKTVNPSSIVEGQEGTSTAKYFGGIVGYNTGLIENSLILKEKIEDQSTCRAYFGGIAAINAGTIRGCSVGAEEGGSMGIIVGSNAEGSQLAGGFVAYLTPTGVIEKSFTNISIECSTAAGFAPYLVGKVSECYNIGTIKGNKVGGFAVYMAFTSNSDGGAIENCYTKMKLEAVSETSELAGLALEIRDPAKIEKCYMACEFSGGKAYYESKSNTREGLVNWVTSWANKGNKLGNVNNVLINKNPSEGEVTAKESKALISYNGQVVKYLTNDEIKSTVGVKAFQEMGFNIGSTTGWTYEEGQAPYLTAVEGLNGFFQDKNNINVVDVPEIEEFFADGTEKVAAVDTEEWTVITGNGYTAKATEAGTYQVALKLKNRKTSRWSDESANSVTGIIIITWEIKPAA